MDERHDLAAWLAWHSGYISQVDPRKVPLSSLLSDRKTPAPIAQSEDELNSNLRAWGYSMKMPAK